MLSVGDLVWVPFTYSYTAYYLATHPKDLGTLGCAGVLAVQLVGYWVFRGANNEKNEFRQGRNPKSAFRCPSRAEEKEKLTKGTKQTSGLSKLNAVLVSSLPAGGVSPVTRTSTSSSLPFPFRPY
jgi:hypothetical protein